jgi:iron complex transport system ATP-binding protein
VLHNLDLAIRYADEVIVLKDGMVEWAGEADMLTPDILRKVYGVNFEFVEGSLGKAVVASL